jgi:predicted RNA-binding protein YlxR (DUF448 family)
MRTFSSAETAQLSGLGAAMPTTIDPGEAEAGPERTCIVTRAKGAPDEMIRFVLGPGDAVVPDIRRKLPGRGVWVTASARRVAEAAKKNAFARGFRKKAVAPESLAADVEALLTKDCLQALSMANKAGLVVAGFGKVEEAISGGALAGLVHASDGGADGVRKLGQCLRRRFGEDEDRRRVILFRSAELDLALGRANVIHAALLSGAASDAFLQRCRRLTIYRDLALDAGPSGPGSGSDEPEATGRKIRPAI